MEKNPILEFVNQIARMTQDGEKVNGKAFVMENDDAVATLNELISTSRELLSARMESSQQPDYTINTLIEEFGGEDGCWGEHPDYPRSDWQHEVSNGDTNRGYWEWVVNEIEQHQEEEA